MTELPSYRRRRIAANCCKFEKTINKTDQQKTSVFFSNIFLKEDLLPKNIDIFKQEINNKNRNISTFSKFFRKHPEYSRQICLLTMTPEITYLHYIFIFKVERYRSERKKTRRENKGKIEL